MRLGLIAAIAVAGIALAGCADEPLPVSYTPSSTMTATGAVQVGDFKYMPAINGKEKPNVIHNTALGTVALEKNVDQYVRDAVFTEMRFMGIKVGTGDKVLTGSIKDFLIDDLGYSVDWTLDIDYQVTDASGKVIYESDKLTKEHTAKFANAFVALNNQIKNNIEALVKDPDFIKAINSNTAAAPVSEAAPPPADAAPAKPATSS